MTLKELVEGLNTILKSHPELADREVYHASECGYSAAGFEKPVQVAVPVLTDLGKKFQYGISIVSDDDGYRTDKYVSNWNFISSKENKEME